MESGDHRRCSACGELSITPTRHSWLESVTAREPREYRRNRAIAALATLVATVVVTFAVTRILATLSE